MNNKFTNSAEAYEAFRVLSSRAMQDNFRVSSKNLKMATIKTLDTTSRIASVITDQTSEILSDLMYGKGITDVRIGDRCLVFTPDTGRASNNLIIAIF